jgi:HK97 family phage portal protein
MNVVTAALETLGQTLRSFVMPPIPTRDPALTRYLGYGPTSSGTNVTEYTALTNSAFWAAVQLIANAVAGLPLFLYRRLDGRSGTAREKFTSHPLFSLLHDDFNAEMTSVVARATMQAHVLVWGNAYAEIERNASGTPLALWPITPDRVLIMRDPAGDLIYRVQQANGTQIFLDPEDVLHIKGQSFDGILGYSVVRMARETIGLGLAQQTFGSTFYANGAAASLVASHPGVLSTQAHDRLKAEIIANTTGSKRNSVLLLEEGITITPTSIPQDDQQYLESRKFEVTEIARWFNIPPHKIADLERGTYSNIESQSREFVQDTLTPWLVRWESEFNRKLIRPLERTQQFTKFIVDGLLRGDYQNRMAGYAVGRQWGIYSTNDIRALEDMNPIGDQGDIYLTPINMAPSDRIHEIVDAQVEPPAAPTKAPAFEPPAPSMTAAPPARALGPDPAVIAAHRAMLADGLGRMVRKEARAASRAAKRGGAAFTAWQASFYAQHERDVALAIRPAVLAHVSQIGTPEAVDAVAAQLAQTYVAGSRAALATVPTAPNELENAVDLLTRRWEATRAQELADALMIEEVRHATAHAQ